MKTLEEIYGVSSGTPTSAPTTKKTSKRSLEEIYGVQAESPINYGEIPAADVGPVDKTARLGAIGKGVADMVIDPFREVGAATHNVFTSPENDIKSYENLSGDSVNVPGYKDNQEVGGWETTKQLGGAGLGIASTVVSFLKGAKAIEAIKGGSVALPAALGYAQDVSDEVKQGNTGASALLPGMNTAFGAGIGIFAKGANALMTPVNEAREKAFMEGVEGLRNRTKVTEKAFNEGTIVRKTDAGEQTITPVDTWFKNDAPIPSVNTEGGTASVNATQAVDHFNNLIKKSDDGLIEALQAEGVQFNVPQIKKIAQAVVDNTSNVTGIAAGKTTRAQVAEKLLERIDNLAAEHGDVWDGPAVRAVLKGANSDFKDEATKDVSRLLGDTMREFMYNYTTAGRNALGDMQELIKARDFAEIINGKKVAGGGLGRYFARILGAAVGNSMKLPFGIGETLGAIGADKIAKTAQKSTFINVTAEAKAKILKLLGSSGATKAEVQAADKAIKVRSLTPGENKIPIDKPVDYYKPDSELPTIDMGPKAQSKFTQPDPNLPTTQDAPNVYGKLAPDSYLQEPYTPDNKLPKIAYGAAPFGIAGLMDKIKGLGKETYTREPDQQPAAPQPGVIDGIDITKYATDPEHEVKVEKIYSKIPDVATSTDAQAYIDSLKTKYGHDIKVTGDMIEKASKTYNVSMKLIMALMQNDSMFGTTGKGRKSNNPGNIGNNDSGDIIYYPTMREGVNAVARQLARFRATSTNETVPNGLGGKLVKSK